MATNLVTTVRAGTDGRGLTEWDSGQSYVSGDYAIYLGHLFKCTSAHTSTSTFGGQYWVAANPYTEVVYQAGHTFEVLDPVYLDTSTSPALWKIGNTLSFLTQPTHIVAHSATDYIIVANGGVTILRSYSITSGRYWATISGIATQDEPPRDYYSGWKKLLYTISGTNAVHVHTAAPAIMQAGLNEYDNEGYIPYARIENTNAVGASYSIPYSGDIYPWLRIEAAIYDTSGTNTTKQVLFTLNNDASASYVRTFFHGSGGTLTGGVATYNNIVVCSASTGSFGGSVVSMGLLHGYLANTGYRKPLVNELTTASTTTWVRANAAYRWSNTAASVTSLDFVFPQYVLGEINIFCKK